MPNQVLMFLGLLISTFLSGYWLAWGLTPTRWKEYKLYFSFILGVIWLCLSSAWLSYIGLSTNEFALPLFGASTVLSIIALIIDFRNRILQNSFCSKQSLSVFGIASLSSAFVLLSIVYFKASNPYTDGFTYLAIADYLLNHSYFETAQVNAYAPWLSQMRLYQEADLRMGAQFLMSFFTALFNRELSMDIFVPSMALSQFVLVLVTWVFCRLSLKMPIQASMIACGFIALHTSLPLNITLGGFLPQAFGLIMAVLLFSLFIRIEELEKIDWRFISLTSLAAAGLVLTYSEYVPFAVLSILVLVIYKLIRSQKYKLITLNLLGVILGSILLSNVAFLKAFHAIKIQLGAIVGWNIPYTLWDYILLVFSMSPTGEVNNFYNAYPKVYFIISVIALILLILVLKYCLLNKEWNKNELWAISSSFLIMLVYSLFFSTNPFIPGEVGQTWSISKIVQYMTFLFPPLVGMAFFSFYRKSKIRKIVLSIFGGVYSMILICFIIYYTSHITVVMTTFTGNKENPIGEYYALRETMKEEQRSINLVMSAEQNKHRQMIIYFLKEHKLIGDWSTDGYLTLTLPPDQWTPEYDTKGVFLTSNFDSEDRIANMEVMKQKITVDFENGVYTLEGNDEHNWRWASGDVFLKVLNTSSTRSKVILNFGLALPPNVTQAENLEVWYADKQVEILEIEPNQNNQFDVSMNVNSGISKIQFKFKGEPVKLDPDPRSLAYSIVNFEVQETE